MKKTFLFVAALLIAVSINSCKPEVKTLPEPVKKTDITEYLGQWTIDIQGGTVGWLEVKQENEYLDADLLWIGGSVLPVSDVYLAGDKNLIVTNTNNVVRTKDEKGNPLRTQIITDWLEISKTGDKITGFRLTPKLNGKGLDSVSFAGTKLPPPPPAPDLSKVKYGTPVELFNSKDLTGWKIKEEGLKSGWSVVDGVLTNNPEQTEGAAHIAYGNLRTEQVFEDFNLKLEFNIPAGSNSGVYLRGMYEIQVADSYKKELDTHNMGAVYSRIKPVVNAEKPAGTWQSYDITLCDRHITVILNGIKIIDNQPVFGPTGGAMISDVFAPGPIYLQGDHGKVQYRNFILTPIVK
jgi:hypothetical protein